MGFTTKEKNIITLDSGRELDVTFVPMAIHELYGKYQRAVKYISNGKTYEKFADISTKAELTEEETELIKGYEKQCELANQTALEILHITSKVNGNEISIEELKWEIGPESLIEVINRIFHPELFRLDLDDVKEKKKDNQKS